MGDQAAKKALWTPTKARAEASYMGTFARYLEAETGRSFARYSDLHAWSVEDIARFWGRAAAFLGINWTEAPTQVLEPRPGPGRMLGGRWFPDGRLSWTANLLTDRLDASIKIISIIEGRPEPIFYTGRELYAAVARCARVLKAHGIGSGDRVAAVLPHTAEAVIGMLAAASLGAIWSSCSPDFGVQGIVDRFEQIAPKALLATRSYVYNGKIFDCRPTARAVLEALPSVELALMIDPLREAAVEAPFQEWESALGVMSEEELLAFKPIATPFDHPLYILFSSGTTGKPKCLVHSVGGTLLQHKKELMLHCNLGPGKRLLYYTTCGWMMWNWMASALSVGASLVLFEGSVSGENFGVLWRAVADHGVTCLGSSPKFLSACQKAGLEPARSFDLSALETLLSTGSPLMPEQFEWVYAAVGRELHLASISGGTDIVSCFMLGNPLAPVYAGEIQGPGLGMSVDCWDEEGRSLRGQRGELVCTQAFPSMPLGFWGDDGRKYREAYFSYYPGCEVWRHGDFIEINEHGGIVVYGRSDATLNPGGVRIGTAEIYRQVETFPEIQDSLAVSWQRAGDAEMVLFLKLVPGRYLDQELARQVKQRLREQLSPRHVPQLLCEVPDIPYTRSGKKLELAVTRILEGRALDNLSAVANPESLKVYQELASSLVLKS